MAEIIAWSGAVMWVVAAIIIAIMWVVDVP
jgi:hypothetical protein